MRVRYTTRQSYDDWESDLKEVITKDQFEIILATFNHMLFGAMVTKGHMFNLPYGIGVIGVVRRRNSKNPIPRFDLMYETGIATPNKNWHSGGWYGKIAWFKALPYCYLHTKKCWSFRPYRANKKWLSREIIENNRIMTYLEN